jgi:hypothetical protein
MNDDLSRRITEAKQFDDAQRSVVNQSDLSAEDARKAASQKADEVRWQIGIRMKEVRDANPGEFHYHGEAIASGSLNAKEFTLSWKKPAPRRALSVTVDIDGGKILWGWYGPEGRPWNGGTSNPHDFDLEPLLLDLADQPAWSSGKRPSRR